MKNSKRTKILLAAVVGLFLVCFIQSSLACKTIKRSLDDWFYDANGMPLNPNVGTWNSDELIIFPHSDGTPVWEYDYNGFVHDRVMSDGRHMITVKMRVKGVPVIIETYNPENPITLFVGEMDYLYKQKFIIDLNIWPSFLIPWADDDGFDEYGNVLLPVHYIPLMFYNYNGMLFPFGIELISVKFIGIGEGVLVNSWNNLDAGEDVSAIVEMFAKGNGESVEWPMNFIEFF